MKRQYEAADDESIHDGAGRFYTCIAALCTLPHAGHPPIRTTQGEDDGSVLIPVDAYLAHRMDTSLLGVYALYDGSKTLQYVGFSRNMCLAIKVSRGCPQRPGQGV